MRNVKKTILLLLLLAAGLLLSACGPDQNHSAVTVLVEDGANFTVDTALVSVEPGEDVSFIIRTAQDYAVTATDYKGTYTLTRTRSLTKLVLEDVRCPTRIRLTTSRDFRTIRYEANGGEALTDQGRSVSETYSVVNHSRPNVSIGTDLFAREGHTLTSWNTKPDGSGLRVGLGSRVTADEALTLYAQWAEWTPAQRFSWELKDGNAVITGCSETGATLVVPESLEGHPVTALAENAFADCPAETVILPKSIARIEGGAFAGAKLRELCFFDNVEYIADACFPNCENFSTLRISAIEDPYGYHFRRESVWVDKLDRLIETQGQDRLLFYGGCSMWYNLSAPEVLAAFGERYTVLNMAVNGLSSSLLQMEILRHFVTGHDILIHTPEIASRQQLLTETRLQKIDDRLWAALEYNYDLVALVDIRVFDSGVLDSFQIWLNKKKPGGAYTDVYRDSKGRDFFDVTGCIPFLRDSKAEKLSDEIVLEPERLADLSRLEQEYRYFTEKGVPIYVSFACIDIDQVPEEQKGNVELMGELFREKFSAMEGVTVFGRIEDFIYHDEDFYDTVYHLQSKPAQDCTLKWLRDLKELLPYPVHSHSTENKKYAYGKGFLDPALD